MRSDGRIGGPGILQIKSEETKTKNDYEETKTNLAQCSYFEDQNKWNNLFDVVHKLAIQLEYIKTELEKLERNLILFLINHSNYLFSF
jgi:hypothetical protein